MRKKLIALFTAVMVLTGYSLPAFAEEIAEPESVITVDSDIAADSETTEENGDVMEGSDSGEDADTSADADAEVTAAPDEDITGETVTDTAETTEETVETAVPETEEAETADEEAAETAEEIADAAAEDTEELLEEELELNTDMPAWVQSWDNSTGTLTLQGQLPDTYARGHDDGAGLAELAGIRADKVKKIVITSGTKAGTSTTFMFGYMGNLSAIEGLKNLDTSNVTDMNSMFYGCSALKTLDLSSFDTSKVILMSGMFYNCRDLTTLDLSSFDTSKVIQMSEMFYLCLDLTTLDLSSFDTSKVLTMRKMFYTCDALTTLDLSSFDTSKVRTMSDMFNCCSALTTLDLSSFDTSNVTDMSSMFDGCLSLTTLDLSSFNTSNVTDMSYMFRDCSSLTSLDLSSFDTSKVTDMDCMFYYCYALKIITVSDKWSTASVTTSAGMFNGCTSLKGGAGTVYDISKTDKTYARIDGGASQPGYFTLKLDWVQSWDEVNGTLTLQGQLPDTYYDENTSTEYSLAELAGIYNSEIKKIIVTSGTKASSSTAYMFFNLFNLTEIEGLENLDTSNATDMSDMFMSCQSLRILDLSGFDTSKVTEMHTMFAYCSNLTTIIVSDKWTTAAVRYSYDMFTSCEKLRGGEGTGYNSYKTDASYAHIDGGASNPGYFTEKVIIPAKPTFTVTAGDKSVAVKWNDVSGATSYRVYRKTGTNVTFLKEVTATSYTDTGLKSGTKYGYLVRAFNSAGGTTYTDADWKYVTTAASAPVNLAKPTFTVTAGDKSVAVKWNAVSGATSYRVYQKNGTAVKFLKEVTTTSYTDSGLTNGTKYGYLVRAFAGTTGTGYTDADWKYATPAAATTLAKPAFTVTAGDKSVTVKWNAVSGATSYRIYRKTGTSVAFLKEVTTLTYTDTGLTNGTKYGYLVRAFKGTTGTGYTDADWKYATPAAATTLAKPNFTVTAATGSATVKWSAVSGAASYRVYRMDGTTVKFLKEVTTLTYTDTTVANGTKYGYLVRAFKGTTGSAYTNADFKYVTPLAKPAVTLTAGTKQVTIKWNKVTGATSYRVYRIDGSAITALTNTTGTSYTATGLTTGTKYGFTVRAFNGNDASTYASNDVVYTTAK